MLTKEQTSVVTSILVGAASVKSYSADAASVVIGEPLPDRDPGPGADGDLEPIAGSGLLSLRGRSCSCPRSPGRGRPPPPKSLGPQQCGPHRARTLQTEDSPTRNWFSIFVKLRSRSRSWYIPGQFKISPIHFIPTRQPGPGGDAIFTLSPPHTRLHIPPINFTTTYLTAHPTSRFPNVP